MTREKELLKDIERVSVLSEFAHGKTKDALSNLNQILKVWKEETYEEETKTADNRSSEVMAWLRENRV